MWGKNEQAATPPSNNRGVAAVHPSAHPPEAKPAAVAPAVKADPVRHEAPTAQPGAARSIIGKSVTITADVVCSEDLYIDGELKGSVSLKDYNLTIGPNGKVGADITARNVIVYGALSGNVQASEKVEIRKTGSLLGDLTTAGVTIEDGAYFKGSIDIVRPAPATAKASRVPAAAEPAGTPVTV
jgi:cytoskeletal protein CcmA (bactofilin family)